MGFLENKWARIGLTAANVLAILGIIISMAIQGSNPDTKQEMVNNLTPIIVCAFVLMLSWWGLSTAMFASSPVSAMYYIFFMLSVVFALSFVAISIAVMIKS